MLYWLREVLSALSVVVVCWEVQRAQQYEYKRYEGAHCPQGASLGTFTGGVMDCARRCERTVACAAFVYLRSSGTCDLKKSLARGTVKAAPTNIADCLFFYRVLSLFFSNIDYFHFSSILQLLKIILNFGTDQNNFTNFSPPSSRFVRDTRAHTMAQISTPF